MIDKVQSPNGSLVGLSDAERAVAMRIISIPYVLDKNIDLSYIKEANELSKVHFEILVKHKNFLLEQLATGGETFYLQNKDIIRLGSGVLLPLIPSDIKYISKLYDESKLSNKEGFIEIYTEKSVPILAPDYGKIMKIENIGNDGSYILIGHDIWIYTYYRNIMSTNLKIGDYTDRGNIIGMSGDYFQYGIKFKGKEIDPLKFNFRYRGNYVPLPNRKPIIQLRKS
ncbi:MAG: M23 family metallopeptidase [Leptospiraceae bacterium]|nr:M23 family metallopeptidase [Leptospiraceae bacterium]